MRRKRRGSGAILGSQKFGVKDTIESPETKSAACDFVSLYSSLGTKEQYRYTPNRTFEP